MRTNLVYTCKYKLIGIDGILPLLMETKKRNPFVKIIIIFPDEFHQDEIKKNYHIWKALKKIDAKLILTKKGSKLRTGLSLIKIASNMILRKNVVIKNSDILPKHALFIKLIKYISKTTEIFAFISNQSIESYKLFQLGYDLSKERNNIKEVISNNVSYDYYLSSPSNEILESVYKNKIEEEKFVQFGYPRNLPEWKSFVREEASMLDFYGDNYFVFYLTGISGNRLGLDEPEYDVLLIDVLKVLKKYNEQIKTVFKPHIITAMDEFKKILKDIDYSNYLIDYAHPMIMAKNAKFAISYTYSSTLFDAYYLGKPVVLFTQYDPELRELLNGKSEGGRACDVFIERNQYKLDEELHHLIIEEREYEHDPNFIKENFIEIPSEFWNFWDSILE